MEEAIFSLIYIAISLLLAAVDISLAVKSLRKNCKIGTYLGGACIGAAVVDISYLASILLDDYFRASVMSSIYFASIDWTLVCLLVFTRYFTKHPMNKKDRIIMKLILAYMVFDTIIFLINPFKEIAIRYEYRGTMIAKYKYHMMPLYQMHLAFSYFILILVFVLLIYKITKIPTDYRRQYRYTLWVLLAAVIINAVFLFLPGSSIINLVDYSICAYSIIAAFFYWNCFDYSTHGMLNHFRNLIFENIDQGIALFDYEGHLILYNQRITRLLPGVSFETEMSLQDFMAKCGFSSRIEVDKLGNNYTLQCYTNKGTKMNPIRCDYRLLKNKRNEMMGHLFVLSDASLETDVLTGFQDWESFRMFVSENPENFGWPTTVVICDINNLSNINNSFGHSRGDQAIQMLAEKLRKFLPENSYFVRGQNANLIALCYHFEEQEILERLDAMQEDYQWNIQYAVSMATKENPDILQAINRASQGMRTKKLLNRQSGHSDFLTSLVCALQECDSDTEAHVKRTQNMGAMLGKRLGLSDVQLSNLSLLCLLHDIGKIGIPLEILNKPGKLSDTEWRVMKSHVEKGYQIANSAQELKGIADMILHHHERWDGKGYPDGLSRESIPLLSRVISVVDAYDAMVSNRCYRAAMPKGKAMAELKRCAGTQFDPTIVAEFLQMLEETDGKQSVQKDAPADSLFQVAAGTKQAESMEQIESPDDHLNSLVYPVRYCRYVLDKQMKIVQMDETFKDMTGYTPEEVYQKNLGQMDLICPQDRTDYLCMVNEQLAKKPNAYFEHRLLRKDGSTIYVFCYGKQYYDSAERSERIEVIIANSASTHAVKNIVSAETHKAQARLQHWESIYRQDPLTGLMNHTAFQNDVEARMLQANTKTVMLMMDIDHFKEYNDTLGHRAGDEFLILVAQTLSASLDKGSMACRMGGDEFAAVIFFEKDQPDSDIYSVVKDVFEKVNMTVTSSEGGTSLSMGMAVSDEKHNSFNHLYEAADQALYKSKESGRSKLSFYEQ